MPPRTKPAADEQCPSLKLVMEKGPLSGQTNDFGPQARIHIGRVARGNTLSIKDAGVSSKHLSFQAETLTDAPLRRWTVADLASSNGTFLNGVKLPPNQPTPLSDGDVVKIGEQTSILVNLVVDAGGEIGMNPRRNARRGARKLGVIDEESELGLAETNLGVRVRTENDIDLDDDKKLSSRRTRKSKKDEDLEDLIVDVDEAEVKRGTSVGTRRTRNSKKDDNLSKDDNVDEEKDLETRVSVRRTRSSRKEENTSVMDSSVIEGRRTRKGTRGRKNQTLETPLGEKEKEEVNEEEERKPEVEVNESEERGRENSTAFAGTSEGAKEGGAAEDGNGEVKADLEKMTLGEWFDFLEVYLPKQIIDETEEMISEMRRKAEKVHEFRVQHKNAKKNGDVATEEKAE